MNISQLVLDARVSMECVVPPVRLDPRDGRALVTYDGLRISLHRLVWMMDGRELSGKEFLLQQCGTFGCVSPYHHAISNRPWIRLRCANDHPYRPEDVGPDGRRSCSACREARSTRRRRGGEPNWASEKRRRFCPAAHEYTEDNIYWEITPSGGRKRHCKTCVRARRAGVDPADVAAA